MNLRDEWTREKDLEEQSRIVKKHEYMFTLMDRKKTLEEEGAYYPIVFGFECERGWYQLIEECLDKLAENDPEKTCKVAQIKEKFGGLRIYLHTYPSKALNERDITGEYERKSYTICEVCGAEGKLTSREGWYQTLCTKHKEERGAIDPKIPTE